MTKKRTHLALSVSRLLTVVLATHRAAGINRQVPCTPGQLRGALWTLLVKCGSGSFIDHRLMLQHAMNIMMKYWFICAGI